jgi:hypothetical protein
VSKYGAKKVVRDGITFDSAKEARRFGELSLLQRAGEIFDLQTQVKYVLIPAQKEPDTTDRRGRLTKGKLLEREVTYRADFVYRDKDGNTIVEDVKGMRTKDYVIKRKLMLWVHGIKILET